MNRIWLRKTLACLLLALLLLPGSALARGLVDTRQTASLTLRYPVADITFRLYRVAEISDTGTFALTEDYADCGVSLDQKDQTGWKGAAAALDAWTAREAKEPDASGKTAQDGTLTLSGLALGMYLVAWDRHTSGGDAYTPDPFLISLPGLNEQDGWVYSVTADPKYGKTPEGGGGGDSGPGTVDRKVLKVWADEGQEDARPASVRVQLLRDGKVYDTVTLSAGNGWRHTWKNLSDKYTWQVVEEDVPDGYTVTVAREGITFVVTNTAETDIPDEPSPEGPGEPGNPGEPGSPGEPEGPSAPGDGTEIPDEPTPQGSKLPQTGVLWWPVPLLACGGMALFLLGWARRRREEDHEA